MSLYVGIVVCLVQACSALVMWVPAPSRRYGRLSSLKIVQSLDRSFVQQCVEKVAPSVCIVTPCGVRNTTARGTGVVVRVRNGQIGVLTAAHVVLPGWQVSVSFDGKETQQAKVICRDQKYDLAFLEVDGLETEAIDLRNETAKNGEFAIACGYPGLFPGAVMTTTLGVVAAVYSESLIADAAVAPGMSGGPLVDADGNILGITTRLALPIGSSAVPASVCTDFLESLDRNQNAEKPSNSSVRTVHSVILFNDPFNTRQRVQEVLVEAGLDLDIAARAMKQAHTTGSGIVREFSSDERDAAEKLCLRLRASDLLVDVLHTEEGSTIAYN